MHPCGHRGKRINAFHTQLPRELDKPATEGISPLRWLGIADEHDDVVLAGRVLPGEEAAARQSAGADQPLLDFDMLHVE